MALNKSNLRSEIEKIFNVKKSPEVKSLPHCAQLLTSAIIQYLGSAKIAGLKAPGIGLLPMPTGIPLPGPDPTFGSVAGQPMSPVIPASANSSIIQSGLTSAMQGNITDVDTYAAADAAFIAYVAATYTTFSVGHYIATGVTAPGSINLSPVLGVQYESSDEIATNLSNHIHSFFTSCTFTGPATGTGPPIGPFVTPGPHVGKLQ